MSNITNNGLTHLAQDAL